MEMEKYVNKKNCKPCLLVLFQKKEIFTNFVSIVNCDIFHVHYYTAFFHLKVSHILLFYKMKLQFTFITASI